MTTFLWLLSQLLFCRELFLSYYPHLTRPIFEEFEVDDAGLLDYEGGWKGRHRQKTG